VELLIRHGMPAALASEWRGRLGPVPRAEGLPELTPLQDGQAITLGGDLCKIIWTPGHADGQHCLYNPSRRLLFGADHLLQKMPPPMLQAPHRRPALVSDYLGALAKVAGLDVSLVLPGHGAPFSDLRGHVLRMTEQVEHRLARMLEALTAPTTAFALVPVLYPRVSHVEGQRYVLAEIVSYLEHLVAGGRAVRRSSETGPLVYQAM
jgi:glyoxylase-like metal-dependent hydrolase (beta-lactamase superfamily II)